MAPRLSLPLAAAAVQLASSLMGVASGFGVGSHQRRTPTPTANFAIAIDSAASASASAAAFSSTKSGSRSLSPSSRGAEGGTALRAGLRDLVGPYDDLDYVDGPPGSPAPSRSIRDVSPRRSPGFVGFDRDRSYRRGGPDGYPSYDISIDAPYRGDVGSVRGRRRDRRRYGDGLYDDLPGSSTRPISAYGPYAGGLVSDRVDPYDRGLDDRFINTNGYERGMRRRGGRDPRPTIDVTRGLPARYGVGGGGLGGRPPVPQVYRRDYLDTLDGRPFDRLTAVERYFEAWNRRDVPLALSCFDEDVYFDDTAFSEPFDGKDKLADHLLYVADCLPDTFYFVIDELSVGPSRGNPGGFRNERRTRSGRGQQLARFNEFRGYNGPTVNMAALWHVENEFGPLPFARGTSFFKVDPNTNLIVEGYEFQEPAVFKTGGWGLRTLSVASKLTREPRRWFPFFAWVSYVYIVYYSNGILPGKDIFHADPKTWKEVQELTFNFLFFAPAAGLPTAAKLNPVLEGLFNGLLAWSFMFCGFLSDERSGIGPYGERGTNSRYYQQIIENQEQILDNGVVLVPPVSITKKNALGLVPTIIGMQFFTSAFLLPYLFSRTAERYTSDIPLLDGPRRIRPLYKEELDRSALVLGESKVLGAILFLFGLFCLWWGAAGGKPADFGPPIWVSDKRAVDFMKLMDNDRVATTFVLDLWIFGIFQGWLVDDDWKRRGRSLEEEKFLRNCAKFIPFFGLASYMIARPKYPSNRETFDYDRFFQDRAEAIRRVRGRGVGNAFDRFGGGRFRDDFDDDYYD